MARRTTDIGKLASAVLTHVETEERAAVKTAAVAPRPQHVTSSGQLMQKLASQVRAAAEDSSITYADMQRFLKNHGL